MTQNLYAHLSLTFYAGCLKFNQCAKAERENFSIFFKLLANKSDSKKKSNLQFKFLTN